MVNRKSKSKFKKMCEFFETLEMTDDIVELDQCTTILNLKAFVDSHLSVLKNNSGNKLFHPYYIRLEKLYDKYQNEK